MPKVILKIKAVIFDMDGVITNTMPDHFHAWSMIMKNQGVHVTHLDIYSREGQRGINSVRELFTKYKKPFSLKLAEKLLKEKEEYFKKIVRLRFIEGTRSLIKNLKSNGFQLALVTGTSRHEMHRILPDEIYNRFSVVITGNDVKHGKPHPEPYLLAIKRLGIKNHEAVVIENAPFGIKSAKDAGLRCVALETSLPKEHLGLADHVYKTIKHLRENITFVLS